MGRRPKSAAQKVIKDDSVDEEIKEMKEKEIEKQLPQKNSSNEQVDAMDLVDSGEEDAEEAAPRWKAAGRRRNNMIDDEAEEGSESEQSTELDPEVDENGSYPGTISSNSDEDEGIPRLVEDSSRSQLSSLTGGNEFTEFSSNSTAGKIDTSKTIIKTEPGVKKEHRSKSDKQRKEESIADSAQVASVESKKRKNSHRNQKKKKTPRNLQERRKKKKMI